MENTRVPIGHKYYFVSSRDDYYTELTVSYRYESGHPVDNSYFSSGNYFATEADALKMADKINALFDGADVIMMPDEDDLAKMIPDADAYDELANGAGIGWRECYKWLKDKIVK